MVSKKSGNNFKRYFGPQTRQISIITKSGRIFRKTPSLFTENSTRIVLQLAYSPYLALSDFWLFLKLMRPPWGHCFESIEEIKRESQRVL